MKLTNILPTVMGLDSVSPEALNQKIKSNSVVVIDVNSRQSWVKNHVPGALNLDPETYTKNDLPSDELTTLVFYCSNSMCRKAPNAARKAKKMGYSNVRVMPAGISGWVSATLPVESGSS